MPIEVKVSQFSPGLLVLGSKLYIVTGIDSLMPCYESALIRQRNVLGARAAMTARSGCPSSPASAAR